MCWGKHKRSKNRVGPLAIVIGYGCDANLRR